MRERFDGAFDEVMFSAAVWSSNQDPLRPKVTCITRLEHQVDGPRDPGTRWGIDNPDTVYRVIPISGDERYEIRGRVGENRMTENYFTLWDAQHGHRRRAQRPHAWTSTPTARSSITVDSDPAGGRPNHVQSTPEAHEFYIRDVLLDWDRDDPNQLEVERLGGAAVTTGRAPSTSRPRRTAAMMAHFAELHRQAQPRHVQDAAQPLQPRLVGRQGRRDAQPGVRRWAASSSSPTRRSSSTSATAAPSTSPCRSSNIWGTTLGIVDRTGSLNKAQSVPNDDGTYTYVISPDRSRRRTTGSTPTACTRASSRCGWPSSPRAARRRTSARAAGW